MTPRSLRNAQERLRDSEERLQKEYAEILSGAPGAELRPDPPVVCPSCHGQVPPRDKRCPHCGHDFTGVAPEVAAHARWKAEAVPRGFVGGLRVWARVVAMMTLAALSFTGAPGTVVLALAILVPLLPGLVSLGVVPLALVVLPMARVAGPSVILAILTAALWRLAAQHLHRPMLSAKPLVAALAGAAILAGAGLGWRGMGWLELPAWYARTQVQPSDRAAVREVLGIALPDTVSIARMRSPGRHWPAQRSQDPDPVLYDMEVKADDWLALAEFFPPPRAFDDGETTHTIAFLGDIQAFAQDTTDESPLRLLCEEDDLVLMLDTASSPTLHLYLAIGPSRQ